MPAPNQPVMDFLLSRRSRPAKTLTTPVPQRRALEPILTAAARSPDHGKLEPWRFVVLGRAVEDTAEERVEGDFEVRVRVIDPRHRLADLGFDPEFFA